MHSKLLHVANATTNCRYFPNPICDGGTSPAVAMSAHKAWGPDSIEPLCDGCGDEGSAEIVGGMLVVAGGVSAPVLEAAPQPFDHVSKPVGVCVVGDGGCPAGRGGNDGLSTLRCDKAVYGIGVVAPVGDQAVERAGYRPSAVAPRPRQPGLLGLGCPIPQLPRWAAGPSPRPSAVRPDHVPCGRIPRAPWR